MTSWQFKDNEQVRVNVGAKVFEILRVTQNIRSFAFTVSTIPVCAARPSIDLRTV